MQPNQTYVLPRGQQMVQGFPVNRSFTKDESIGRFITGVNVRTMTVGTTQPSSPQVGDLWCDTN